jgi:DNA repair protein RadC
MAISDWPSAERPREKLLQRGASALSDAELLAIFLRTGVKGKSAVDLARELLSDFNGLRHLLAADRQRFCRAAGLGDAKYAQLQAVVEMTRRYHGEKIKRGVELTSPDKAFNYLQAEIGNASRELFGVLFLDTRHRVISFEILFSGTIDGASVHPREVVKRVLQHNAAAVILAHNHPSGVAEPSRADIAITEKIKSALALVEVRLLDHIIVTANGAESMADHGLI